MGIDQRSGPTGMIVQGGVWGGAPAGCGAAPREENFERFEHEKRWFEHPIPTVNTWLRCECLIKAAWMSGRRLLACRPSVEPAALQLRPAHVQACQQRSNSIFRTHDVPAIVPRPLRICSPSLRNAAAWCVRQHASLRRGAAAYGDASRHFGEPKTLISA